MDRAKRMLTHAGKGYLSVVIAAVLWASSGTVGKALFESGVTPFDLVQIRVTFASLILAAFFLVFDRKLFSIRLRDVGRFVLIGGVVMALVQVTYFYTISKIQVMAAILLQYLSPILVALFSMIFWGERPTRDKMTALVLAIGGCYLVVGGYSLELLSLNRAGIISGLLAAVCYAAYALLGEWVMHRYSPWTVVFYALFFAAVTWHIIHPPFKYAFTPYSAVQWAGMIYIVVFGTIVTFGLYFVGINYIRSTRAMITATLEPIAAGVMAFFFLGEQPSLLQMVGAAMAVAAVVLLQIRHEDEGLAPETLRGEVRTNSSVEE